MRRLACGTRDAHLVCGASFMMEVILLIMNEGKGTLVTSEYKHLQRWCVWGIRRGLDG